MEPKIPTIEKHIDAYIKIRIIESLDELALALKRGSVAIPQTRFSFHGRQL